MITHGSCSCLNLYFFQTTLFVKVDIQKVCKTQLQIKKCISRGIRINKNVIIFPSYYIAKMSKTKFANPI